MKTLTGFFVLVSLLLTPSAMAREASAGDVIGIQDMNLTVPDGWSLRQDAKDEGTIILGFEKGTEYLTIFVKQQVIDMRSVFVNGSQIVRDIRSMPRNSFDWKVLETTKSLSNPLRTSYVASFLAEHNGYSYYGYSKAASNQVAMDNVNSFLQNLR
jgi:hypothetical protein